MFNTKISFYGLAIVLALIFNILIVMASYKKYGLFKYEVIGALMYENIGIILGAKLLTYFENIKLYGKFNFYTLGLSSYGAVIGAILFLTFFSWQFKKDIKKMLFLFMPSIPLMYAVGKIGCFLVGCCYGIEYEGFLNVIYNYSLVAPKGVKLFPIQLVETICFFGIFIYMFFSQVKDKFDSNVLALSFIMCGLCKFGLDYLRASHVGILFSWSQVISIVFVLIGIILLFQNKFLRKKN